MKKKCVLFSFFIVCIFIIPFLVNAKSNYFYDLFADWSSNNGGVEEYTGLHNDSVSTNGLDKIYYWTSASSLTNKSNVIFAGYCWKIIRTTDTGGIKLLYNGVPGENNSCGSNRSSHYGYGPYTSTYISQSYYYGSNFEYNPSTKMFTLVDDIELVRWSEADGPRLVGHYTCKSSSNTTCSTIYYVDSYVSPYYAYMYSINSNTQYSVIGESSFNVTSDSLSDVSYTYGKRYPISTTYHRFQSSIANSSTSLPYGDDYYVDDDGRYGLTNYHLVEPSVWKTDITPYLGKYKCKAGIYGQNSASCVGIDYISPSSNNYYLYTYNANENVLYSDSFSYDESTGKYTLIGNTKLINKWYEDNDLGNRHYTCLNGTGQCDSLAYIFYKDDYRSNYITLTSGESIEDAMTEMLTQSTSKNDSSIKKLIDIWFSENMLDFENNLEDVVFCNNRVFKDTTGFNNTNNYDAPYFNHNPNKKTLLCEREEDSYSVSNEKAKLKYPVGLMTANEIDLNHLGTTFKDGKSFWLMSPAYLAYNNNYYSAVYFENDFVSAESSIHSIVTNSYGIRPVVSLKTGASYSSGDGSRTNPFIFDKIVKKSSINVEVVNETEDLTVEINDMTQVEEDEKVKFIIKPIKGYSVKSIRIVDKNNTEISFSETEDKNEYVFTMPSSDVIITPIYERISSSVNYENNQHSKEIIIEVNDITAVVYDDKVKFTVEPEDGYEVDTIEIKDEEGNNIEYRKTNKINEYEFTMPDTDVRIIPTFKRLETGVSELKNPKTGSNILVLLVIMSLSIGIFIYKKKKNLVDSRSRTKFKI